MRATSDDSMKQMAELLRSGAKMLSQSCPECGSPLFQLKSGEIWCANCQRRVVIVSEGEDVYSLSLAAEDVAQLRADLGDIRIVDDADRQVPYILERAATETRVPLRVEPDRPERRQTGTVSPVAVSVRSTTSASRFSKCLPAASRIPVFRATARARVR